MKLTKLTTNQITELYNTRMKADFPPDELKPLAVILDAISQGIYEALGLFDGGEIIGYACLLRHSADYLVDYLAIYPGKRNSGAGSSLLALISEHVGHEGNVIIEVEDPEYAETEADRELRTRRLAFYLRNGCCDTGVRVSCFGVKFIILTMEQPDPGKEDYWERYSLLYEAILPKEMYNDNIERM